MSNECEALRLYGDIIELTRPVSSRKRMSLHDRAAQFSSFAALTGYDDMVREQGRLTQSRTELTDEELEQLDRKLAFICSLVEEGYAPEICITYFEPDKRKSGGSYVTVTGRVKETDAVSGSIVLYGSEDTASRHAPVLVIPFRNIADMTGGCLEGIFD